MAQALKRLGNDDPSDSGDQHEVQSGEPRWFFQDADATSREDIVERYRQRRAELLALELSDYGAAQQWTGRPPRLRRNPDPEPKVTRGPASRRHPPAAPGDYRHLFRTYLMVAGVAVATGSIAGFGVSQFDRIKAASASLFDAPEASGPVLAVAADAATSPATTTIVKKPVVTAQIDVADVSGSLNSFIPLALRAEPGLQSQDLILKLSGLPPTAYLTAGTRGRENDWQLKLDELKDVKLVVPQAATQRFDVAVAAFETETGELAAPVKEMTVALNDVPPRIEPASAPPASAAVKTSLTPDPTRPSPIPLPVQQAVVVAPATGEAAALIAKGDRLFESGDLLAARQFYEQAFARGAPAAAFRAGQTFDPAVFAERGVKGLKPDPVKARDWYTRAAQAGNNDAALALQRLAGSGL